MNKKFDLEVLKSFCLRKNPLNTGSNPDVKAYNINKLVDNYNSF